MSNELYKPKSADSMEDRKKGMVHKVLEFSILFYLASFAFGRSFSEITLALMAVSLIVIKVIKREMPVIDRRIALPLLLFLTALAVSSAFSINSTKGFKEIVNIIKGPLVLVFAIQEYVKSKVQVSRIQIALLFMLVVQGVDGIYQYFTGIDFIRGSHLMSGRVTGSFSHPTKLGNLIALGLLLAIVFAEGIKKVGLRVTVYILLFFPTATLIFTQTRTAWISFAASFAVIFVFSKRRFLYVVIMVIILFSFLLLPSSYHERFKSIGQFHQENPRILIWSSAFEMFKDSPIIGVGPTIFGDLQHKHIEVLRQKRGDKNFQVERVIHPHNIYIQSLAEFGAIGSISLMYFLSSVVMLAFSVMLRSRHLLVSEYTGISSGVAASIVCFLIQGLTGHSLFRDWWLQYFFFLIGLLLVLKRLLDSAEGEKI